VSVVDIAAAAGKHFTFTGNYYSTTAGVVTGAGLATCIDVVSYGNTQAGAGFVDSLVNNYFDVGSYPPAWSSSITNPALGNGTLVGWCSRKGKSITVSAVLTLGSSSTQGTGTWAFTLPYLGTVALGQVEVATAMGYCAGMFYSMVGTLTVAADKVQFYPNANANAVGVGVPGVWVAGQSLRFSITYTAANFIG
jgi:hypothetical protein